MASFTWADGAAAQATSSVTSLGVTLSLAVGAGDVLVAVAGAPVASPTITDTAGNTWVQAKNQNFTNAFYCLSSAAAAGGVTVTLHSSSGGTLALAVDRFTAAGAVSFGAVSAANNAGNSGNFGSLASVPAGVLLYGGDHTDTGNETWTAGSSNGQAATSHASAANTSGSVFTEYVLSATGGTESLSWSASVSTSVGAGLQMTFSAVTAAFPLRGSRRSPQLLPPSRRYRQMLPVPAQLNPPFPVAELRQWRQPRGLQSRRGHGFTPVPAQQAAAPAPAWVPQPVRHARLLPALRRRLPAVVPAAADLPLQAPRHARPVPPPRRGHPVSFLPGQDELPRQRAVPRQRAPQPRRGHVTWPPQAQAAAPAPAWVQGHRPPLRALAFIRRRFAQLLPWPQAVQSPSFSVGALTTADGASGALTAAAGGSALMAATAPQGSLTAAAQTTGGPS